MKKMLNPNKKESSAQYPHVIIHTSQNKHELEYCPNAEIGKIGYAEFHIMLSLYN